MGNKHSRSNFNSSETGNKNIDVNDVDNVDDIEELDYYLLNNLEDVDRQHIHQFFKINLFGGCFSVPIEERLIQGGCKILDVA
jgi:hypothetical protein